MGGGRFTATDWDSFTTTRTAGRTTDAIFTTRGGMDDALNPAKVVLRESRDSADNPNSTPIIVALDVTGSMGMIADAIARDGLNRLFTEIYDRQPVPDPHIAFMGVGDVVYDRAPLQVSQFEADIRIADQLTKLWLERGGGGNRCESYNIPWYFAAMKTATDAFEKRGRKGYLFTVGDEEPPERLLARELEKVFGPGQYTDLTSQQLLDMASRAYNVFHVMVEEGSHMRHSRDTVVEKWTALLGQRALLLSDHTKLPEVIVSAIQVNEGTDAATVAKTWSGDTSLVVAHAVKSLTPSAARTGSAVVEF